jgi:hypothetical protein
MRRRREGIRLTHLPTGLAAQSLDVAPGRSAGNRMAWYREKAVGLLIARLNRPRQTSIRRTYDLAPPLGIEPNIRQDGQRIATGRDEVMAFLDGRRAE